MAKTPFRRTTWLRQFQSLNVPTGRMVITENKKVVSISEMILQQTHGILNIQTWDMDIWPINNRTAVSGWLPGCCKSNTFVSFTWLRPRIGRSGCAACWQTGDLLFQCLYCLGADPTIAIPWALWTAKYVFVAWQFLRTVLARCQVFLFRWEKNTGTEQGPQGLCFHLTQAFVSCCFLWFWLLN